MELYGDDPAVPFEDLAAEMATEARLIHAVLDERVVHAHRREAHAHWREAAYSVVDFTG